MADPTVKLIFAGNSQEAERVITGLERKVEGLENKLKRLGDAQKSGFGRGESDALGDSLESVAARMTAIAGGAALIGAGLRGAAQEAVKFNQEVDATWSKLREAETKMRIATGWTPQQAEKAMPALKAAVMQTPALTLPEMIAMQTEIAGAGFADADVESGAAAKALLRVRAGMASFGKEMETPGESAKAIAGLLAGMGGDMNAAGIERVGMKTAALAAKTALQFSDLKQLSQASGALSQLGVSESEMLAAFSVTQEAGGAMIGSTGLKNIGLRLGTAGGDKGQIDALKSIGLKPEDVAISKGGLNIGQVGEKLRAALAGKTEVQKNIFFKEFFGGDAVSSAATLFSDAGWQKYGARLGMANNAAAEMGARIGIFDESREAMNRRAILQKEFSQRDEAQKGMTWGEYNAQEEARRTAIAKNAAPGVSRMMAHYSNWIEGIGDWFSQITGETPDTMNSRVRREAGMNQLPQGGLVDETIKQQLEESRRHTALLEKLVGERPIAAQGQRE